MSQSVAAAVVPPNKSMTFTASELNSSISAIIGTPNGISQALPKLFIVRLAEMNWNDRIKQMREKNGLKPAVFAKLVGVSGATISDWESGVIKQISGKHLVKAAAALGITPEWIMTGYGSPDGRPQPSEVISDEHRELINLWGGLFEKQKRKYLDLFAEDIKDNREVERELEKKRVSVANRRTHNTPFSHAGRRWDDKEHGN